MLRPLGAALAALLAARGAAGEEDAVCLLQYGVAHSSRQDEAAAAKFPHWVLMPPGTLDATTMKHFPAVPADKFGNPMKPFSGGQQEAAQRLATEFYVRTKQQMLLDEYKTESENLRAEALRWKNNARLAEVEARQIQAGLADAAESLRRPGRAGIADAAQLPPQSEHAKVLAADLPDLPAPAGGPPTPQEAAPPPGGPEGTHAALGQASARNAELRDQVKSMRVSLARLSGDREALHGALRNLTVGKLRLQRELGGFEGFLAESLRGGGDQGAAAAGDPSGTPLLAAPPRLMRKVVSLAAAGAPCEEELKDLQDFIGQELLFLSAAADSHHDKAAGGSAKMEQKSLKEAAPLAGSGADGGAAALAAENRRLEQQLAEMKAFMREQVGEARHPGHGGAVPAEAAARAPWQEHWRKMAESLGSKTPPLEGGRPDEPPHGGGQPGIRQLHGRSQQRDRVHLSTGYMRLAP